MPLKTADKIAKATQTELFLGLVAPVGIRVRTFICELQEELHDYGYTVNVWRLSDFLEDFEGIAVNRTDECCRLTTAMDAGTEVRDVVGRDALARAGMAAIAAWRQDKEDHQRSAHVFWSLKHPEEVATLKLVYGRGFHLIGLFASEEERVLALSERPSLSREAAQDYVARDADETGLKHGQRTRDTFQLADVYLEWGQRTDKEGIKRFLRLLFGDPHITPTAFEHHMFLAFCNATRSGELSRQVGAALIGPYGDLLALGANDVPQAGGGLYWPGDADQRDHVRGQDANTVERERIIGEVLELLAPDDGAREGLLNQLRASSLSQLTEYGRSVHAEMDALLTCARNGMPTRGATLFVTTYPCHNCARHIIAAGIERVVYVEPYPKSQAVKLHPDAINDGPRAVSSSKSCSKVDFVSFVGVGPRRYLDYFSMRLSDGYAVRRKRRDGTKSKWEKSKAVPRVPLSAETYMEVEYYLGSELEGYQSLGAKHPQDTTESSEPSTLDA